MKSLILLLLALWLLCSCNGQADHCELLTGAEARTFEFWEKGSLEPRTYEEVCLCSTGQISYAWPLENGECVLPESER